MTVEKLIEQISEELRGISGIAGVVLGGSRARGTSSETSDVDIGIYYDETAGFDLKAVSEIATRLDDRHRENLIFAPGQWGPWVNGGGWLVVKGYHVDFIFTGLKLPSRCCWRRKRWTTTTFPTLRATSTVRSPV